MDLFDPGYFFRAIAAPPKISPQAAAYYGKLMKSVSDSKAWKDNYLDKYMLSPLFLSGKDAVKFVAENEKIFADILKDLGLVK